MLAPRRRAHRKVSSTGSAKQNSCRYVKGVPGSQLHAAFVVIRFGSVEADQDRFRKAVALAYDVLAMRSESDQMSTDSLRALLQTVCELDFAVFMCDRNR